MRLFAINKILYICFRISLTAVTYRLPQAYCIVANLFLFVNTKGTNNMLYIKHSNRLFFLFCLNQNPMCWPKFCKSVSVWVCKYNGINGCGIIATILSFLPGFHEERVLLKCLQFPRRFSPSKCNFDVVIFSTGTAAQPTLCWNTEYHDEDLILNGDTECYQNTSK